MTFKVADIAHEAQLVEIPEQLSEALSGEAPVGEALDLSPGKQLPSLRGFTLMRMISYVAIALTSLSPIAAFAQSTAPINENSLYIYRANVVDVFDADTITVDVDLGFYMWLHKREFRLSGINAPEVTGIEKPEGEKARDFLRSKILAKQIIIQSIKNPKEEEQREKNGEFLAIVWLDGINLNDLLVKEGYAKRQD